MSSWEAWLIFGAFYLLVGASALWFGYRLGFVAGWLCGRFHNHVPAGVAARAQAHMKEQEGVSDEA